MSYVDHKMYEMDIVSTCLITSIPPRITKGLESYVWWGIATGGFLKAVLENDLMAAVAKADPESLAALKPICQYVYGAVPSVCHGSPQAVQDHIKRGIEFREYHSDNEE